LILQNASILQYNPPKFDENVDIVIDGAIIKEVGKSLAIKYRNVESARIIDLDNKLLFLATFVHMPIAIQRSQGA